MSGLKKQSILLGTFIYTVIDVVSNLATIADSEKVAELLNSQSFIKVENGLIQIQWLIEKHQFFRSISLVCVGIIGVALVMIWAAGKKEKSDLQFIGLLSCIKLSGVSMMLMALLILTQSVSVAVSLVSGVLLASGLYILRNGIVATWRYASFKP